MAAQSVLNLEMLEILNFYGGHLNLPGPGHRQWGANITHWLKRGLNVAFIEHIAKSNQGQEWSWSRRRTAKLLEWEFNMETQWRLKMESSFQRMMCGIVFGVSGSDEWEASVTQCYKLGFNVEFVEDIERRQKSQPWTWALQDRAKSLEWEFHRTLLISKYTEGAGKSTARVVKEMLEEKGIKLAPDTLSKRLTEWGIPKRRRRSRHASAASIPYTDFSASTLTQPTTTPSNALANRSHPRSEISLISPALLSSKKCAPLCPTHMGGNTAGVATGIDASAHYPVDSVQYLPSINSGDNRMFTMGSTQITNRWDGNQFQDVNNGSFCTQLSPLEGCLNLDQRSDSENQIRQRSNSHLGYQSSSRDACVPRLPPSSLHEPSQEFSPGITASANTRIDEPMSSWFQTSTSPYTTAQLGGNDSDGNSDRKPNQLIAFPLGATLQTKIGYLRGTINIKENELMTIQTNYNTLTRELIDARQQLQVLSSDPRDLTCPADNNETDAYGISN